MRRINKDMELKLLLNLTKNLIVQPMTVTLRLASETKNAKLLVKEIGVPYLTAIIIAQYIGNVIFGHYYFTDSLIFLQKVAAPKLAMLIASLLLFSILLNEIMHYFSLKSSFSRSVYIISYTFIPVLAAAILSGLLPKLEPLITLCGLYSYYILWFFIKAEYPDINEDKHRKVSITTIVSMIILHWAIVGCTNLIF